MDKNYQVLKKFTLTQGADLFGVADISAVKNDFALSQELKNKFNRAVCIGARLSSSILQDLQGSPTKLYFHHYRTLNAFLDQLALKVTNFIQAKGYSALPIPASQIIDWENQKAHLSHKKIGVLAGLGWLGRNNLLVNKNLGSSFRITTVLTDMPFKADKSQIADCGKCTLCVTICPAGAIKKTAQEFDHLKCFAKLKEFQKQRLVDQYICGVCVKVCQGAKR